MVRSRSWLVGRLMHNNWGRFVCRGRRSRLVVDWGGFMIDRGRLVCRCRRMVRSRGRVIGSRSRCMNNWSMNNRSMDNWGWMVGCGGRMIWGRGRGRMVRSRGRVVWSRCIRGVHWKSSRSMNLCYWFFIPSIAMNRLRSSMWLAGN